MKTRLSKSRTVVAVPLLTAFAACATARLAGSTVPSADATTGGRVASAILVPTVHRSDIASVDADASGRFVLAVDTAGFAAIHDLETNAIRLVRRIAEGGEPTTFARIDADARFALVSWTGDEDDPDAVALWDLRRDRVELLPTEEERWTVAIGTNRSIDTIATIVSDEEGATLEVRDRSLALRCSASLDGLLDAGRVMELFVANDGAHVDVVQSNDAQAARLTLDGCEARAIEVDAVDRTSDAAEPSASIAEVGDERVLHVGERSVPFADLPSFAEGGEYAVRDLEVDASTGALFVATRHTVVEITGAGVRERCPGTIALERAPNGRVFAIADETICDVARGNFYNAMMRGFAADGSIVALRYGDDQGPAEMMLYDPAQGSWVDPPAFLRGLDPFEFSLFDDGRTIVVADGSTETYVLFDGRNGGERGSFASHYHEDELEYAGAPFEVGRYLAIETGDARLAIIDPQTGDVVRAIDDLAGGYPQTTGSFVRLSERGDSTFLDVDTGETRRVPGELRMLGDGLVVERTDSGSALIDVASGRRRNIDGEVVSYDASNRDLATCVGGELRVAKLDESLAPEGGFLPIGPCDGYALFVRLGPDVIARSNRTVVELHARGAETITIRLLRTADGLVSFATDASGRAVVFGGAAAALRRREAGDPLTASVGPVVSDEAFAAEVDARLHGRVPTRVAQADRR